jgi:hypothetical protein
MEYIQGRPLHFTFSTYSITSSSQKLCTRTTTSHQRICPQIPTDITLQRACCPHTHTTHASPLSLSLLRPFGFESRSSHSGIPSPSHPKGDPRKSRRRSIERTFLSSSLLTHRIPPLSTQRITLLFMYQHDQSTVFRHLFKLQLFRIPRKPCSPDITSCG